MTSNCSDPPDRRPEGIDVAVLKSWDFGAWQSTQGAGSLPYRMDHLEDRGIRLHWTDRLHTEDWQRNRISAPLRRAESMAVPFAQTLLLNGAIRHSEATFAMFESEANFLAAVRHVGSPDRRRPFVVLSCWLAHVLVNSGRARRSGYRWAYETVDLLYYFSKNQGRLLSEALRLAPERLQYLRFGVDTETFSPEPGPDDGYLLAVGRDRARDWPTLFEAVKALDMPVKVCCRRSQLDGITIPPNVEVLGHVDREIYRELLGRAAVVAVIARPVEYPSGQSVLLESMAMGKSVVVSETPSLTEYIRDGIDCLAVPSGDPAAARERIDQLAGDPDLRARLGRSARRSAEEYYSSRSMWNIVADDLIRLTGERR